MADAVIDPPETGTALECLAVVQGPLPSGPAGTARIRQSIPVSIAAADFPVACILDPETRPLAYLHGEGRFWRPVPPPTWLMRDVVRADDVPVLLSGRIAMPWPDNPFSLRDGTEPVSMSVPHGRDAADLARATCDGLRLVDGILHRAVPEPFARLDLVPSGRRNEVSVSFGPWTRPSSRRLAFPLHRFPDLLQMAGRVHAHGGEATKRLATRWPKLKVFGIYGTCQAVVPALATPPNLGSLPASIRDLYLRAQSLGERDIDTWREIAGEIGLDLALVDDADPAVAHGLHWLQTELSLPLIALKLADGS